MKVLTKVNTMKLTIFKNPVNDAIGVDSIGDDWIFDLGGFQWKVMLLHKTVTANGMPVADSQMSLKIVCVNHNESDEWGFKGILRYAIEGSVFTREKRNLLFNHEHKFYVCEDMAICEDIRNLKSAGPARSSNDIDIKVVLIFVPVHDIENSRSCDSPSMTDVEFIFDNGKHIFANREYLSKRSPVLKRLFRFNKQNPILIQGEDFDDFHSFMKLMHLQHHESNKKQDFNFLQMLRLAGTYETWKVLQYLEDNLEMVKKLEITSFKNVPLVKVLVIAKKYNLKELSEFILAKMSPDDVYRVNHDPKRMDLDPEQVSKLVKQMRHLDLSKKTCEYCREKMYCNNNNKSNIDELDDLHMSYHLPRNVYYKSKTLLFISRVE